MKRRHDHCSPTQHERPPLSSSVLGGVPARLMELSRNDSGLGASLLFDQSRNSFAVSPGLLNAPNSNASAMSALASSSVCNTSTSYRLAAARPLILSPSGLQQPTVQTFRSPPAAILNEQSSCVASTSTGCRLQLSQPESACELRFDGQILSSLGANKLLLMGSPDTEPLSTPKTERRFGRSFSEATPGGGGDEDGARLAKQRRLSAQPLFDENGGPLAFFAATSTPVRPSSSVVQATAALCPRPVLPVEQRSPDGKGRGGQLPRTPTPFKRAMAAVQRRRGRIDPRALLDASPQQTARDLHEIIERDRHYARRRRTSLASSRRDTTMDFDTTPSKLSSSSVQEGASPEIFRLRTSAPPPLAAAPVALPADFLRDLPRQQPPPLSREWMTVVCGRTRCQLEMTAAARQLLGLSPPR